MSRDLREDRPLSWSRLSHMAESPLAYYHASTTEREDTPAMRLGRATHSATLTPEAFGRDYLVWEGTRRGKAWDEFVAAHADAEIITAGERTEALAIAAAVRAYPPAAELLASGSAEVEISWTGPGTGIDCRGRLDWVGRRVVADLKTTSKGLSEHDLASLLGYQHYHAQLAWYVDGLREYLQARSTPGAALIVVESAAPYDVAVIQLDEDTLDQGRRHYRRLLDRVVACREAGEWPGRYQSPVQISVPRWAREEE